MEVLKAWFGRAGMGVRRSRRQVIWCACILVTAGVLYLQYAPSGTLESGPHHRALNLYPGERSEPMHVKFVQGGGEENSIKGNIQVPVDPTADSLRSPLKPELQKPAESPNRVPEVAGGANREVAGGSNRVPEVSGGSNHVPEVAGGANRAPETVNVAPEVVNQAAQRDMAGSNWGAGQYRYNPYGEPVYSHGDRPNYIPPHRVVHFDLKGAPPKISSLLQLLPWLVRQGATAVLLEYEDTFPWHGRLREVATKNHYTAKQITGLVSACRSHGLEVIPLVQTFGHLEFALKHERFRHMREVPELPQALCPSLNESLWLVKALVDQTMALHPGAKYLHIGCDEVFQLGECERCRLVVRETLFLQHVEAVAKYVRQKYAAIPIIWDDMLRHVSEQAMEEIKLGQLVEPMVWVYAEDVYRFVQPSVWTKFSQIFGHVWAASAYKGAFGEQLTVPNVRRHLDNNLNWLDVMASESAKFSGGFRGLVLTGWQRYDHFAILCELLPAALPSLAVTLLATSHGYFNSTVQAQLYQALNCMQTPKYQTWLNLDSDPYLWDKFSWCFFPGAQVFKATARLDSTKRDVDSYIDRITRSRGWITDYNRRHNFSSPMRIDEDLEELPARLHAVTLLLKTVREALSEWFDDWTVGEWIELHIWPMLNKLQTIQRESESMKLRKTWPARPLPILPQLAAFGITEPSEASQPDNEDRRT